MALPLDPNSLGLDSAAITEAIIRQELKYLAEDRAAFDEYRDYYEGDQSLILGTSRFKAVFGEDFKRFKDNWCAPTIRAVLDKLTLQSFASDDDGIVNAVWDVLAANEIESQQLEHHEACLVEGRSYVIVWPNPTIPGAVQVDWNPPQQVRVRYSEENPRIPEWAVKTWRTPAGEIRITIYYPDRVEKYRQRVVDSTRPDEGGKFGVRATTPTTTPSYGGLERREIIGEPWPLPNPFGTVPVVEFNNPSGSELKDVIPIQDWINYSIIKLMVGGEFSSWPQRAVAWDGEEPDGGWSNHPGRVWQFPHKLDVEGRAMPIEFHTYPAADQSKIINEIEMALQHIAGITSTPVRYYKKDDRGGRGDAPSGESQKVDDQPLIDKVETRQVLYGAKWARVAGLVAMALNGYQTPPRITPRWKDARAEYRFAVLQEAALMKDIGMPYQFIVSKLGLTKEEEDLVLRLGAGAGYEAFDGGGNDDGSNGSRGADDDERPDGGPAGGPAPDPPPAGAARPGTTRGQV